MATVLVIDDDQSVRDTVGLVVAAIGHEVLVAANGLQGIEMFASVGSDLVITDILMPEKDGIETIRELRQLRADLPIIAMSGGGRTDNSDYLEMARRFGANRTLAKPFEPDALIGLLTALLPRAA